MSESLIDLFNLFFDIVPSTNLSFGKDLKLPKGSVKKLSNIVFNNRMAKFKKTYYPAYWMIIHLILKIIPFSILRILKIK